MKINDYSLEVRSPEESSLYVYRNGDKIFVQDIRIAGYSAAEVDKLVKEVLNAHQMEVVDVAQTIVERDDLADRKTDLSMVRTSMRKILKNFGNANITLQDKKNMIDIYEVMCKAADVITKSCVVELAYDRFGKEISK